MPEPLDFRGERDRESDSWARSHPDDALIEPIAWNQWRVMLPGGSPHVVTLKAENGAYSGRCDCKGFEFRDEPDSPCAHLCAIRRAHYDNTHNLASVTDTLGNEVRIIDADQERADQHVEAERARADGGALR